MQEASETQASPGERYEQSALRVPYCSHTGLGTACEWGLQDWGRIARIQHFRYCTRAGCDPVKPQTPSELAKHLLMELAGSLLGGSDTKTLVEVGTTE